MRRAFSRREFVIKGSIGAAALAAGSSLGVEGIAYASAEQRETPEQECYRAVVAAVADRSQFPGDVPTDKVVFPTYLPAEQLKEVRGWLLAVSDDAETVSRPPSVDRIRRLVERSQFVGFGEGPRALARARSLQFLTAHILQSINPLNGGRSLA